MIFAETECVELKEKLNDGFEKEVVAFLNTVGGQVIIGVNDSGEIVGVDSADKDALAVADRIKNIIAPSAMGLFNIEIKAEGGKCYIIVTVAGGLEKPYYIRKYGLSSKGCFVRIGTQSCPMEQFQIDKLLARKVNRTLSTVIAQRQDLTFTQLRIFYEENGFDTSGEYFFKNLGMFTEDGKFNYFAMLLSDQSDVSIKLARFKGKDKVEIITNKEFGYCCILKSVYNVLDALDNYNLPSVEITYPKRVEKYLVDKTALREAAINAIVHNDYLRGGAPLFEIYDDRINIVSCGGLVSGLSQEEFFNGYSMPRNRELMRVFRDMELVENFGSGMRRILQKYNRDIFKISENFISTELKYDEQVSSKIKSAIVTNETDESLKVTCKVTGKVTGKVNPTQSKILNLIEEDPSITVKDIMAKLSLSESGVRKNINILKSFGLIRRIGSDKAGHWEIIN